MKIASLVVAVAVSTGLTFTAPLGTAYAKPPRPTVTIPSSFNIPWWDCEEDAWTWVDVKDGKRVRVRDYDVTIRKPGYTEPIGDEICGYMGSGTYNFRVKVYTQKRGWKWKKRAVYKTYEVQELIGYTYGGKTTQFAPFDCQFQDGIALQRPDTPDLWGVAVYDCLVAGEPNWNLWNDGGLSPDFDYSVNREIGTTIVWPDDPGGDYDLNGQPRVVVSSTSPGLRTGERITGQIRVTTGIVRTPIYETKVVRKFDHWKRYKVRAWKNSGSFVVTGQVRVNVS